MLYLFSGCVVNNQVYVQGATNPGVASAAACKAICVANPACTYYTWNSGSLVYSIQSPPPTPLRNLLYPSHVNMSACLEIIIFNPVLHTWFRDSCLLVMAPHPYRFPFARKD